MTEFNIKSLPFSGGVEITNNDLNVVREDNLDNCLIIKYDNYNFIKISPNNFILSEIQYIINDITISYVSNIFMRHIYYNSDYSTINSYSILVEFVTDGGYILKMLEL